MARAEAERIGDSYIGSEHLFLGLLDVADSRAVKVLRRLGLEIETVRQAVEKCAGPGRAKTAEDFPTTPRVRKILKLAEEKAKELNPDNASISTEHILLGFLIEADSLPARVLQEMGVTVERVEHALLAG